MLLLLALCNWTIFHGKCKQCKVSQKSVMLSLQLLCISGVVISQDVSKPVAVISSTVFDFDIVFSAITMTFLTVIDQSNT